MENLLLKVTLLNDKNEKQPALMYVTQLQQTQSMWINTLIVTKRAGDNLQGHQLTNASFQDLHTEVQKVFQSLCTVLGCKTAAVYTTILGQQNYTFDKARVQIESILYGYYSSVAGRNVSMYQPNDKDKAGETLTSYLDRIGIVNPDLWAPQPTVTVTRKMAFKKKVIDWNKTWTSPYLTDEEKDYLRQTLDLDIWLSNSSRPTYQIFSHIIETEYENRDYTAIGLHGNFGSGKSEMVKCYAAEHDAPMLYIACSQLIKIQSLLAKVGPVLINNHAELTIQETIWLKCFIRNLPLIVNLDEFNLLEVKESNALAPIITEHKVFVDAINNAYQNDNTIIYVGCWNPDTANAKSLDGKMYDRLLFLSVEDIDQKIMTAYKVRKQIGSLFGLKSTDYQDQLAKLPVEVQNKIKRSLAKNPATSQEALDAYMKAVSSPVNHTPVRNQFVEHHLEDVTLSSPADVATARTALEEFFTKVNNALYHNTKGIDTKNNNRNFAFYIPQRATDYACDLIFQYSSVGVGITRLLVDLLPGGGTLRTGTAQTNATSRIDRTPMVLTSDITKALSVDIEKLDTLLFDPTNGAAGNETAQAFDDAQIKPGWQDGIATEQPQPKDINSDGDADEFIEQLKQKAHK